MSQKIQCPICNGTGYEPIIDKDNNLIFITCTFCKGEGQVYFYTIEE